MVTLSNGGGRALRNPWSEGRHRQAKGRYAVKAARLLAQELRGPTCQVQDYGEGVASEIAEGLQAFG